MKQWKYAAKTSAPFMRTLLVVDSEPSIRKMIGQALSDKYYVIGVPSPEIAREKARRQPIDVLVANLEMESTNGIALAAELAEANPHLHAVILTWRGQGNAPLRNGWHLLAKPFRLPLLRRLVAATDAPIPRPRCRAVCI